LNNFDILFSSREVWPSLCVCVYVCVCVCVHVRDHPLLKLPQLQWVGRRGQTEKKINEWINK